MASEPQNNDANTNTGFKFKSLISNVTSTSKLFKAADTSTSATYNQNATAPSKTIDEYEKEIEILKLQKTDLRELVKKRTSELDQLKKLNSEHQKIRKRWKENQEKEFNKIKNAEAHINEIKNKLNISQKENMLLQSKQTNYDLIKNKLEIELNEHKNELKKVKKLNKQAIQEKKMLIAEVLKLRNEKQDIIIKYKENCDKLNQNNINNINNLRDINKQLIDTNNISHKNEIKLLNDKYAELNLKYINFRKYINNTLNDVDSTTSAFESMINNANIGSLSQNESNKIVDNIIHSIEGIENKQNNDNDKMDNVDNKLKDLSQRTLKTLKEKCILQRQSNELMIQIQKLQLEHEKELKIKNLKIQKFEMAAKISFFKKKNKT